MRSTSPVSSGWTPQQFRQAYNVPLTQQNNKPPGYGIKVAVIVAYHYSNLQSDLNKWAQQFNGTPIILNIINQAGSAKNNSWALEAALSVQMINAVSPGATVYVIEAKSVSQNDMRVAMQTAVNLGANIVSMPFGADETFAEGSQAYLFLSSHVVWIAASGDSSTPSFPATYPDVIAVGGTTAQLDSSYNLLSEAAWVDAGAGMSIVERMPSFQMIPSVQQRNTTAYRSVPDVAFYADPEHGAQIYASVLGGWVVVGGTSVSTAFFTGVVANVNSARKAQNLPLLTSVIGQGVSLQDSLYKLMSTNGGPTNSTVLHDVVNGIAGEGSYPAGPGYDIATGLGSLNVQQFIEYMLTQ
jgi:subtilisin family serine protease